MNNSSKQEFTTPYEKSSEHIKTVKNILENAEYLRDSVGICDKLTGEPVVLSDEYGWDDSDESLEDILYWDDELNKEELFETWRGMPFEEGDIVMLDDNVGGVSHHRLYVISSLLDPNEGPEYEGFEMSSKVNKANLNNPKYPANILIKNYGSILSKNQDQSRPDKDVIIKIDQKFTFDSDAFVANRARKGICSDLFNKFISSVVMKYENGMDTSKDYWDNGKPIIRK